MPNVTTREIYHRFFHAPGGAERERVNCPSACWYEGNSFYSYRTEVGRLIKTRSGNRALLVAYDRMSPTTAKHVNGIYNACPLMKPIEVPFEMGRSGMTYKDLAKGYKDLLQDMKNNRKMSRQEDRITVMTLCRNILDFHEHVRPFSASVLKLVETMDAAAREKQQKLEDTRIKAYERLNEKTLAEWEAIKDSPYLEKLRFLYDKGSGSGLLKLWQQSALEGMKEDMRGAGYLPAPAYVFPLDDATVESSLFVSVPASVVKHELKRWLKGEVKEKTHILSYEIQLIRPSFVKIGCHVIPTKNLMALAEHYGLVKPANS